MNHMKKKVALILFGLSIHCITSAALRGQEIPAGAVLELRLQNGIYSDTVKRGDIVRTILIAPVFNDCKEILPAGTQVYGKVIRVKRVGLGLLRERAHLLLKLDRVAISGGATAEIDSQLIEVENAREEVRPDGDILGIRATESYGHQVAGIVTSAATVDPLLALFAFASASSVLRFPEAEISFPAGTELHVKMLKNVRMTETIAANTRRVAETKELEDSLAVYVNDLPTRTHTLSRKVPSDLTNLVFLGTRDELVQAFAAAGWVQADLLDPGSEFETVRALAENRGYAQAPVSRLVLDGQLPALVFEKTLNTFNRRHHLRVWQIADPWNGETVWTAAATHDIGMGLSSKKTLIHQIDPAIDKERSKVVNDLIFANCVDSTEMVPRSRVPRKFANSTGDNLFTDGQAAVLRLKSCAPRQEDEEQTRNGGVRARNVMYRGVRQFDLTMRNSLLRDNVGWQAYRGSRMAWKVAHWHNTSLERPGSVTAIPQSMATSFVDPGSRTELRESPLAVAKEDSFRGNPGRETARPRLPEVAFSLDGGQFFRRHLGDLYLASVNPSTGEVDVFQYPMKIEPGVVVGGSVTLHPSRLFSHELFFGTMQANLITGDDTAPQVDRLRIRTTGYQLEANLAPRTWRLRPFVSSGTAVTTYRYKDLKLTKKNGVFKYGLRHIGTVVDAFHAAGAAPLDGGTVYQMGLTYGGGLKYRVSRLVEFQAEYRETYARDPEFFNKQSFNLSSQGISSSQDPGARRHANYILSFSFTP